MPRFDRSHPTASAFFDTDLLGSISSADPNTVWNAGCTTAVDRDSDARLYRGDNR